MARKAAGRAFASTSQATVEIRPQPGPQELFLSSPADIAIYGGGAGGGKTYALLMDPLRDIGVTGFAGVIFRRNGVQVKNPGGLWDESIKLWPLVGGVSLIVPMEWHFGGRFGAKMKFGHLEHDKTVEDWQGSQLPFIGFDELTHFTEAQFFYMLSRNRSTCGVRPRVRATTNPDADSWVARFIAWWIGDDGFPIKERAGKLRWFVRVNDRLIWADTADEHRAQFSDLEPKSVTFIPALLSDNPALLKADPGYRANLMALNRVARERLEKGNWKIRPSAGLYFRREMVTIVDALPAGLDFARGWDLAGTEKTETNDPDATAATLMGVDPIKRFFIAHHMNFQGSPLKVEQALLNMAIQDGHSVSIALPQDPGQAGKSQAQAFVRLLAGYKVRIKPVTGDKVTRFGPLSAQCEGGNVYVLRAPWNDQLFSALEGFPDAKHDDDADSCSEAFDMLNTKKQFAFG